MFLEFDLSKPHISSKNRISTIFKISEYCLCILPQCCTLLFLDIPQALIVVVNRKNYCSCGSFQRLKPPEYSRQIIFEWVFLWKLYLDFCFHLLDVNGS